MARWLSHSPCNRRTRSRRAASDVLHGDLRCIDAALARAWSSRRARISKNWARSASADCRPLDWVDAFSLYFARKWIDSGHGDARAVGAEAPNLSRGKQSPSSKTTVAAGQDGIDEQVACTRYARDGQQQLQNESMPVVKFDGDERQLQFEAAQV